MSFIVTVIHLKLNLTRYIFWKCKIKLLPLLSSGPMIFACIKINLNRLSFVLYLHFQFFLTHVNSRFIVLRVNSQNLQVCRCCGKKNALVVSLTAQTKKGSTPCAHFLDRFSQYYAQSTFYFSFLFQKCCRENCN